MSLSKEDVREIRDSDEHKDAFSVALGIHQKHEPGAAHFRGCEECKSGYALLLIGALQQTKTRRVEGEVVDAN